MTDIQPATFSFSDAARAQIAYIRAEYAAYSPDDPPKMLGIAVGWPLASDSGEHAVSVMLGYWRESEWRPEAASQIQTVSGIDLIFAAPPQFKAMFDGKIIDYAPDRAFFLR